MFFISQLPAGRNLFPPALSHFPPRRFFVSFSPVSYNSLFRYSRSCFRPEPRFQCLPPTPLVTRYGVPLFQWSPCPFPSLLARVRSSPFSFWSKMSLYHPFSALQPTNHFFHPRNLGRCFRCPWPLPNGTGRLSYYRYVIQSLVVASGIARRSILFLQFLFCVEGAFAR